MKKFTIFCVAALIAITIAGCKDGERGEADLGGPDADLGSTGVLVTKAALIDVLWEVATEPEPNALCMAESSFTIRPTNGIMVMKNTEPTDYNQASTIIVSSINISLPAEGNPGKGADCAQGDLYYIIAASKESPIDIEVSPEIAARHSLDSVAKDEPTPYPENCELTTHFERQGMEEDETSDEGVRSLKLVVDKYDCLVDVDDFNARKQRMRDNRR